MLSKFRLKDGDYVFIRIAWKRSKKMLMLRRFGYKYRLSNLKSQFNFILFTCLHSSKTSKHVHSSKTPKPPVGSDSETHLGALQSVAAKPKKSTSAKHLMQEFEKNGNQSQKKKKAEVVESLDRGGRTNVTTLVDQGILQTEGGGWHPGYLEVLEHQMRASSPQASIEGNHIVGKMKTWKRDYWYLASIFHRPGFGWNANENKFVAEDEVWNDFVREMNQRKLWNY